MLLKIVDRLEEVIISTLMAVATLIIFVAVVHRYLSGMAIPGLQDWLLSLDFSWAQELCVVLFVWMAKFGAAYGVRTGIHVGVDVLINRLPEGPRAVMIQIGLACGAFFTALIAYFGATLVWENGMAYALFTALGMDPGMHFEGPTLADIEAVPTWVVYLAVPLGSALMCFRFVQVMVSFARTGELPHHDHGHVEGVAEESSYSVGEAMEIGEEIEHGHAGLGDAEWERRQGERRKSERRTADRRNQEGERP